MRWQESRRTLENYTGREPDAISASIRDTGAEIGVFEVMLIQEELRRCILEGADRTRFLEAARRASQYVPMLEHAQKLVEEGVSTVDEVIRTLLAL